MNTLRITAAALLAAGLCHGADPPIEKVTVKPRVVSRYDWSLPPGTPAEQVKAITERHKELNKAFWKKLKAIPNKDEEAQEKLFEAEYPAPEDPAGLLIELARQHPKDPAAFDALLWVIKNTRRDRDRTGAPYDRAWDMLTRDYARHPRIGEFCRALTHEDTHLPSAAFVRQVYEKHPEPAARAQAGLTLAAILRRQGAFSGRFKKLKPEELPQWVEGWGKEVSDFLLKADGEKLSKEGEAILERLVADKELAGVNYERREKTRNVGEVAETILFELRHLQPGKPAPDIVGEDIDGKPMRLSDFRGKVVLLDFWGDW